MNLLLAFLFILFVFLVGLIPFMMLYLFSDFVGFLLLKIFGYRKQVVEDNLKKSFPDKSKDEISKLLKKFYSNLSDVLIEGIKSFTMTRKQIVNRHKVINPEVLKGYFEKRISIIAVPAHYNNWEWGSLSGGLQLQHKAIALYKPLNNPLVDRFVRYSRSKFGTELTSIYKTTQKFEENKNQPVVYILAADQSPTRSNRVEWVNFLGRETAFLYGPEKYARKYNYPVLYVDIQRRRRGFYELELKWIAENPRELPGGEIIRRYAGELEKAILKKPENWLWSHRRWKLSR
ncbi:MAG: lysophospholipid acyltransferase family protein [Bacteroidales bacterium]|nr:lysophospholipid acyltransferase family protein [Bacteroidales bacterium]